MTDVWLWISPAERLNSIPIKEVMVPGDWGDVNGKLGIWREQVTEFNEGIFRKLIVLKM